MTCLALLSTMGLPSRVTKNIAITDLHLNSVCFRWRTYLDRRVQPFYNSSIKAETGEPQSSNRLRARGAWIESSFREGEGKIKSERDR